MKKYRVRTLWLLAFVVLAFIAATSISGSREAAEGISTPDTIVLKYIQNKYGPVVFNHSMHASLAGNCSKCHHQHDEKARAECKRCHVLNIEALRTSNLGFLPCSGCHSGFSPDTPGMPDLKTALHKACFECHKGIGELGFSPMGCARTCHARNEAKG